MAFTSVVTTESKGDSHEIPGGDFSDLINDKDSRIIISTKDWSVGGFISSDFTLSGVAKWEDGSGGGGFPYQNFVSEAAGVINQLTRANVTTPTIKNQLQTMVSWAGTSPFGMTIPMVFVALDWNDDVRKPVRRLNTAVYPTVASSFYVLPPLRYARGMTREFWTAKLTPADGCVAIQIGQWFTGPQIFVIESVSFTFSKEVIQSSADVGGKRLPLYARGQVVVKASLEVGGNEIAEWLGETEPEWLKADGLIW